MIYFCEKRKVIYKNIIIQLSKTEFKVLAYLHSKRGICVETIELIKYIYADEYIYVSNNIITVYIYTINKKFGEKIIKNKFGLGYILEV